MDLALAQRPELAALDAELRASEARVDAARSERHPRLGAVVSAGYARFEELDRNRWVAGVGFTVPVFTGDKGQRSSAWFD